MVMTKVRNDWSVEEVTDIYQQPLIELIYQAAHKHRQFYDPQEVQVCSLLSIKTGGCPEDCAYCPQSVHHDTDVEPHKLLDKDMVVASAKKAKEGGASRFCMGAACREVRDNRDFDKIVDMVEEITDMGMEVCCTLGMISSDLIERLDEAGLYAYNHNIDTSEDYYNEIISTRTFQDRLETLQNIRNTNVTVCCGGIIGMGESTDDRIKMLQTLATMEVHPESVPINALVPVPGTPLEDQPQVSVWEMVRMVATARLLMPKSMVRLSAGRQQMKNTEQALCFMAGANSIHSGGKLLTTPNPTFDEDHELFEILGLEPQPAFAKDERPAEAQ
jgi:biotin synthase